MARRRLAPPPPTRRWRRYASLPALGLGLACLLSALYLTHELTRGQISDWERYTFPFAEIDCTPPPGLDREHFLAEVHYLSGLPEQLRLLDDDLLARLAAAFGRHPWVEEVRRVEVGPPRTVRVELGHRRPVLAVPVAPEIADRDNVVWIEAPPRWVRADLVPVRYVDGTGILLPATRLPRHLPVLVSPAPAPAGPAGTPWGDAGVEGAARVARVLEPHQERLQLEEFEATAQGLVLHGPGRARLWGRPPGAERNGELLAGEKVERLLDYHSRHGGLAEPEPQEHDVRLRGEIVHRPLPPGKRP